MPVFSVITPLELIEEPVAPLSPSILPSRVVMSSLMLIWFGPEAPEAMNGQRLAPVRAVDMDDVAGLEAR